MFPLWIFSEGDRRRGMGHLTRCLAYAEAWRELGGDVRWIVDGDRSARAVLDAKEVRWESWQKTVDIGGATGVAIVDSYTATPTVLAEIAKRFSRVLYLDDIDRLAYPKGLVVHGAPGPVSAPASDAVWVRGPAWQPLRRAFWAVPRRSGASNAVRNVLVLMGGGDIRNLSPRMTDIVTSVFPGARIHTVLGSGATSEPRGCTIHRNVDADAMRELMLESDLAITAAGQTVFELAACGTPAVLIGVIDNQEQQLAEWPGISGYVSAGWWHDPQLDARVSDALYNCASAERRALISAKAKGAVDGQGVRRALSYLQGTCGLDDLADRSGS